MKLVRATLLGGYVLTTSCLMAFIQQQHQLIESLFIHSSGPAPAGMQAGISPSELEPLPVKIPETSFVSSSNVNI